MTFGRSMASLSVVISAYNEEDKIKDCLESVRDLADEIIFVDNSSTDKTAEIAKKYTSKVFTRENNPMLNVNKNFGFTKATSDWILSLDADERVSPELKKEIETVLNGKWNMKNGKSHINGYWIPRKNIIFGKWIKHAGWYPDYQLRLFKKGKGKFPEEHVHEMIKVEGKTEKLKEHIVHYNYETIRQFLQKLANIYAPNEAEQLLKNGYEFNWRDAIRFPSKEFLNRFFAQQGYKDGLHGLVLSILMAFYHLVVFVTIWERRNFKYVEEDVLSGMSEEFKERKKEIMFWFFAEKIKNTGNPFKKFLLRTQRKFASL